VSESKDLVAVEQPQQLITIEPAKYVELVFEPFAKRLADAKTLASAAVFDVGTTAGMALAVKHRATFRDIRVASEKARKERKAPILEIGKLLDSRQKEIEAEIEPFESRFDNAIKAEEARKEAEKQAKLAVEKARVDAIRAKIEQIKDCIVFAMGKSATEIQGAINELSAHEITLEEFMEFAGEAEAAKDASLAKLGEALTAQQAHEAEQARIAAERAELEKLRAEAAERERQVAAERAAQEAHDRAERERIAAEQRAAQEKAEAAMRKQQEEHEARMRAQQAEIDRQQAEIAAERQRQADEAARIEREKQAAIAAEAARVGAEAQAKREAEEAAARAEAERVENERRAAEAERIRREQTEFEANGPEPSEILEVLANNWDVSTEVALHWLTRHAWAAMEIEQCQPL
jgi:hypothetical protein